MAQRLRASARPIARPAEGREAEPEGQLTLWQRLVYRCTWLLLRCVDTLLFRTRARGLEHGDPTGPLLLLSNHVSVLDPFCVGLQLWRPCRFMAATSVCKLPLIGPYLQTLGAFPKMKFVKDRDSMRALDDHYRQGLAVTLFPEGVRTWDGRGMPVQPGIGRLIKRMDARVLFARLNTAYLVMPRWAKYPRYVPLEIDYEGPFQYEESATAEEIAADVAARLQVTPKRDTSRFAFGFRLAEGLPELLWACPSCFAQESLEVVGLRRRDIRCTGCGCGWRLDIDHQLHPTHEATLLTVTEAYARIQARFGPRPVLSPERSAEGVLAAAPMARLRRMADRCVAAEGALTLHVDHLCVGGDRLNFDEIWSVSVDIGSQVMLRCASQSPKGVVLRLEVPGESALKWGTVLKAWCVQP